MKEHIDAHTASLAQTIAAKVMHVQATQQAQATKQADLHHGSQTTLHCIAERVAAQEGAILTCRPDRLDDACVTASAAAPGLNVQSSICNVLRLGQVAVSQSGTNAGISRPCIGSRTCAIHNQQHL